MVLVSWPAERQRRDDLAAGDHPRLLLVEGDGPPPTLVSCVEDWVRVPCSEEDLAARLAALQARSAAHRSGPPTVDDDGVVRFRERWATLPPVEARLLRPLLDRFGSVVSRDVMLRSGWGAGPTGRNALDVHMLRLRRRLAPLGLEVRTVRSRGYLLAELDPQRSSSGAT